MLNLDSELAQIDLLGSEVELINREGLRAFLEFSWNLVEPAQSFIPSWSVDALCDHVQAAIRGEIPRLVINVPPNTSKSMICSVSATPWAWTERPELKFIYGCYDEKLAIRDSLRAKNVIESPWYRRRWGNEVAINQKMPKSRSGYRTTAGGFRMLTTPGGSITGEHANIHIIDDPVKPAETMGSKAITQIELGKQIDWWDGTLATRFVSFNDRVRIVVMQRLHEADLSGVLIERGYEVLMLPMEYEPERRCYTSLGFKDPRSEPGELLCYERFTQKSVDELFEEMGGRGSQKAQAQLQQDPTPMSGDIFKKGKEKYYTRIPEFFDTQIQSWDCTFKKTVAGSFVAGQVWGRLGADFYLLDQARDRWSFSETCEQIEALTAKWPKSIRKIIEDKANGPAILNHLKRKVPGMIPGQPYGDKISRANDVEPYWTSGNIYLPHPSIAPWIELFVAEMTKFPNSRYNDQVDAATQALNDLGNSYLALLKRAFGKKK